MMGDIFRRVSLAACAVLAIGVARDVFADDWGCQVLLCLSDPRGPETESACVPPIEKLWSALRHGDPFPSCDFNSALNDLPAAVQSAIPSGALATLGQGTGASNTWASASYCRPDMLYWGGFDEGELMCRATGAINVTIDGTLYTRVWWGLDALATGGSRTEYYGAGSTEATYDPRKSGQQFLKQWYERMGGGG